MVNEKINTVQKEKVYLEAIRIIACFLVIYNHLPAMELYKSSSGFMKYFYMVMMAVTTINVPLFFMISGTLLLGKQETFHELWKKRIKRYCCILIVTISIIYLEYSIVDYYRFGLFSFNPIKLVYRILSGGLEGTGPYWFLYAYIGMLFALPLLRSVAQNLNKEQVMTMVLIHIAINTILPIISTITQLIGLGSLELFHSFSVPFSTLGCFFYPLLGYWIDRNVNIESYSNKKIGIMLVSSVICISFSILCSELYQSHKNEKLFYSGMFTFWTAIVMFLLVKYIFMVLLRCKAIRIKKIICFCGSVTFGIYLMDQMVKHLIYPIFETVLSGYLPPFGVSLLWCICSMLICGTFTIGIKKIPLLGKWI